MAGKYLYWYNCPEKYIMEKNGNLEVTIPWEKFDDSTYITASFTVFGFTMDKLRSSYQSTDRNGNRLEGFFNIMLGEPNKEREMRVHRDAHGFDKEITTNQGLQNRIYQLFNKDGSLKF